MNKVKLEAAIASVISGGASPSDAPPNVNPNSWMSRVIRSAMISTTPGATLPLVQAIRGEPDLRLFDGGVLLIGGGGQRVTLDLLADWLVAQSLRTDPFEVVARLENFVQGHVPPALEVLALAGVTVTSPVELSDAIKLVPFDHIPPSQVTESLAGIPSFLASSLILPSPPQAPTAALVIERTDTPALAPDFPDPSGPAAFRSRQPELSQACELLTLLGPCPATPIASWVHVDESLPLALLMGGWGTFQHEIQPTRTVDLTTEARAFGAVAHAYSTLPPDVQAQLHMPIRRLNLAMRRSSPVDAAVELRIALESLLAKDLDENAPIAFSLRTRGSLLGAATLPDRRRLFDSLKRVYALCSRAAHSGTFSGVPDSEAEAILSEGTTICAALIRRVIEHGSIPDWQTLLLSGGLAGRSSP